MTQEQALEAFKDALPKHAEKLQVEHILSTASGYEYGTMGRSEKFILWDFSNQDVNSVSSKVSWEDALNKLVAEHASA